MTYNSESHISNVEDVKTFFYHIVYKRNVNFHPDDRFDNYINFETEEPTFTPEECAIYDRLIDQSFDVSDGSGVDIYDIGINELFPAMGLETE